jgi:HEAT repeat protein
MIWWVLKQLRSRNRDTRLQAVERLTDEQHPKAWEALIGALGDPDDAVRKAVAAALAQYKDERTVVALLSALHDSATPVREAAAQSLRQLGFQQAIPPLVDTLRDHAGTVRFLAAKALVDLNWDPANFAERAWHTVALGDIEKSTVYGADAVEPLMLVLQDGAYYQRQAAVDALSQIADDRIINILLATLKDPEEPVRTAAVDALRRIGDQRAVTPLILALKDPHKHVRALAAEALGHLADPLAVEPLVHALEDKEWDVREAAIFSLGRFRDPQAVDALIPLLQDADREVRQATVHALELINDPRAITPLIVTLIDPEDTVRQAASRALELIEPSWPRTEFAHQALPHLKAALKDKEYWVRQSAASALARIGEISRSEPDTTLMAEPLYYRRQAAMETLIEALTDFDRDLRFAAAEALGRIGRKQAIGALAASAQDPDENVRSAAAHSLAILQARPTSEFAHGPRGDLFTI